jgi:hypothetical protein
MMPMQPSDQFIQVHAIEPNLIPVPPRFVKVEQHAALVQLVGIVAFEVFGERCGALLCAAGITG